MLGNGRQMPKSLSRNNTFVCAFVGLWRIMDSKLITIFGGAGFIGRYIVWRLADGGYRLRVAARNADAGHFLKVAGEVGQISLHAADLGDPASHPAAVRDAWAVINLVGILYERGRQKFMRLHAEGAGGLARAARAAGAQRFVQVSAIGADPGSPSLYARSKAAGEEAVAREFPDATIIRPSVVFGPEDDFFNRFAKLARISPVLPLIGGGKTRFQPVYVGDVAKAVVKILASPETKGQTFELGGPRIYTFREILELVLATTGRKRLLVSLPWSLAMIQGSVLGLLPKPPLTRDQVLLLARDNVANPTMPGLAELEIAATAAEAVVGDYLKPYRRPHRA
jgi:NADH dehydrogenase